MADVWKQLEGQFVDDKFQLQQYLAGTEHSAVFLTECSAPKPQKAAIKFIAADPGTADRQLSVWERAAHLSHPNLLRILASGRCRLARMDLLYVVLECAEEDLSQVLPDRALTSSETRDLLDPLLEALAYLHGKNFVHSHISPANIHAIGDQLKLASDSILPSGDTRLSSRATDVYTAPETIGLALSSSADIWSLGATLVEVLTQRAPELPLDNQANPTFSESLPQPFLDIVRHALRRDSHSRWTLAEIKARLSPAAVAAVAGQAASPLASSPAPAASVPASRAPISPAPTAVAPVAAASISPLAVAVSNVPAIPAAKLPTPRYDTPPPKPQAPRQRPSATTAPKQGLVLPNYVVPVLAVVFIVVAVIALPKILGRRPESTGLTSAASSQPASQPKPAESTALREPAPSSAKSAAPNSAKPAAENKSAGQETADQKTGEPSLSAKAATPAPSPASLRTATPKPAPPASSSSARPERGEVLEQVLPDVPEKARATIQGRVRVSVRAHVDAAGSVSEAELDAPGPSRYFAGLAVKAARRWVFTSPEIDGRSVPSEWLIHFVFTRSDTKAFPTQSKP
jgi:serine/threonine protein kinase